MKRMTLHIACLALSHALDDIQGSTRYPTLPPLSAAVGAIEDKAVLPCRYGFNPGSQLLIIDNSMDHTHILTISSRRASCTRRLLAVTTHLVLYLNQIVLLHLAAEIEFVEYAKYHLKILIFHLYFLDYKKYALLYAR